MTVSSIEGTLQPPASHETCLFVGSSINFIVILENFAECLSCKGEKRKYKTKNLEITLQILFDQESYFQFLCFLTNQLRAALLGKWNT